jgi:hypothetical protein
MQRDNHAGSSPFNPILIDEDVDSTRTKRMRRQRIVKDLGAEYSVVWSFSEKKKFYIELDEDLVEYGGNPGN